MPSDSTQFPAPVRPSAESLPVDSPLRQVYPEDTYPGGNYFPSPNGRVRYWITGPSEGARVALIHGISAPSIAFQRVANYLVEQGFQVLLYDLHGRGYSEIPEKESDVNLYIIQLALLLQYVGWNNAYIVGFSMGGGIAAAFSSTFPHLVNGKVVFVASAGLIKLPRTESGEIKQVSLPPSKDLDLLPIKLRRLHVEAFPGYAQLLQHDLLFGPITGLESAFKSLATTLPGKQEPLKVLLIHGTADDVVPFTESSKIKAVVPQAELVKIEGANHYMVAQDPYWQQVAENISKFLL